MNGSPVVIFQCGPNSYTFEQRNVALNTNGTPTKIGRSQVKGLNSTIERIDLLVGFLCTNKMIIFVYYKTL